MKTSNMIKSVSSIELIPTEEASATTPSNDSPTNSLRRPSLPSPTPTRKSLASTLVRKQYALHLLCH